MSLPDEVHEDYNLKIASAYAGNKEAIDMELPFKRTKDSSYTILDTTDG